MKILFVCTGNSCRSQMAEGWLRELAKQSADHPDIQIESAGLEAHGLNPQAVAAMAGHGVDISAQSSDVLTDAMLARSDLVVTVCGHADNNCPILPAGVCKRHIPFDDPAGASGSPVQIAATFDRVCLEIRQAMEKLMIRIAEKADV